MKNYETRTDFMKDVKDRFFCCMEYKDNNKKIDKDSWLCYTSKGFPVITYPYSEDQFDLFMDIFNILDTGYENGFSVNQELNYVVTGIGNKFDHTDTRAIIDNAVTVSLLNRGYDPYGEARTEVFRRCHDIIFDCLDESRIVKDIPIKGKVIKFNNKRVS